MNKKPTIRETKKTGISLSELLVVLSVAVVLAAILMPAIAGIDPDRAESILKTSDFLVVFEGIVQPRSTAEERTGTREGRYESDESESYGEVVHIAEEFAPPSATVGMNRMLTTDIRYVRP